MNYLSEIIKERRIWDHVTRRVSHYPHLHSHAWPPLWPPPSMHHHYFLHLMATTLTIMGFFFFFFYFYVCKCMWEVFCEVCLFKVMGKKGSIFCIVSFPHVLEEIMYLYFHVYTNEVSIQLCRFWSIVWV